MSRLAWIPGPFIADGSAGRGLDDDAPEGIVGVLQWVVVQTWIAEPYSKRSLISP